MAGWPSGWVTEWLTHNIAPHLPPHGFFPRHQDPILRDSTNSQVTSAKHSVQDVVEKDDDAVLKKYVAGYLIAVDMTARDVQTEAKKKGMPWSVSKGYDSFLPLSEPFDAEGIKDADWRKFKLWLDVKYHLPY